MDTRAQKPARHAGQLVPFKRVLHTAENLLLTFALTAMVLLPLAEAMLRRFFGAGIPGASQLTQHLVLVVAMAASSPPEVTASRAQPRRPASRAPLRLSSVFPE